jgi:hypothetical protein
MLPCGVCRECASVKPFDFEIGQSRREPLRIVATDTGDHYARISTVQVNPGAAMTLRQFEAAISFLVSISSRNQQQV